MPGSRPEPDDSRTECREPVRIQALHDSFRDAETFHDSFRDAEALHDSFRDAETFHDSFQDAEAFHDSFRDRQTKELRRWREPGQRRL